MPSDQSRQEKIWVTAYLSALRKQPPAAAVRLANDAVDRYLDRWRPIEALLPNRSESETEAR